MCASVPFKHRIQIHGPQGEIVCIYVLFNSGTMVCVMDEKVFEGLRNHLRRTSPPTKQLRLANGLIMPSKAHWEGEIEVEGVKVRGSSEVFDSGGSWEFLLSKPMQAALGVIHDMRRDVVTLEAGGRRATITN
ncbi:hypothetical protein B0H16DRAFT_1327400, partial [Mycena metata]